LLWTQHFVVVYEGFLTKALTPTFGR
jgi:hypothetical protein